MAADDSSPQGAGLNIMSAGFAACPQPVFADMHQRCPVMRLPPNATPIVTRYEDVLWALRHPEIFSSEMEMHLALGTQRPMIPQQIDPPLQTDYRKILDPRFSRRRMLEIAPDVRRHANELIDAVIDTGRCDFGKAFAIPLPCTAFLSLMGLPREELDLFLELKDGIIRPQTQTNDPEEQGRIRTATGKRIYDYFEMMIDERGKSPRDDMMTYLVAAEIEGRKLSRHEILDICFLLLLGGLDTVTASLGCNIAFLAANPQHRQKIVADPSLIPAAIEELLRWETPVMVVPRLVKQDVELSGITLKATEMALLMLGGADVDCDAFTDADRVVFERERNRHVAFGAGPHRCLGSHLARMELTVAMEEWHRRIPDYAIEEGATPRFSSGIREVSDLLIVWDRR
jgi:cytochrome P450